MDEVSLDTLLLSGECDVQWGTRGVTAAVRRTVELHANHILYCFEEPKNSMAKHIREKVYIEGCHVVDGGAYGSTNERLLVFLANHDYAEKVDLLGNRKAYVFASERATAPLAVDGSTLLPTGCYVVQLFIADKIAKWRFLQAIQRASLEYQQLFAETTANTTAAAAAAGLVPLDATNGSVRLGPGPAVPNRFDALLQRQSLVGPASAAAAAPRPRQHSRSSSGVSVLSNHEVLQLSDVLRQYEALQEGRRCADDSDEDSLPSPADAAIDAPAAAAAEQPVTAAGNVGAPASPLSVSSRSRVPPRLLHSPLYESCIEPKPANQVCADCGEPFPSWCILQPFGAFVCIHCVGVHRKLWSNKCRGAELDRWPKADIAFMQARGNDVVNDELEYCVAFPTDSVEAALGVESAVKPVQTFSTIEVREAYIQWKYEEQLFTRRRHPAAAAPLPPREDPAGLERARLAASPDAEARVSDVSFSATARQQQQHALLSEQGPPRYAGLLDVIVKELVGPESIAGAVLVLTNGFQSLRTQAGRQLLHMRHSTAWDEHLQLGVEGNGQKPLYCTVYRGGGELLAAAELWLPPSVFEPGASCMFAAELCWNQLHRKPSHRTATEEWKVTLLTSYQLLA